MIRVEVSIDGGKTWTLSELTHRDSHRVRQVLVLVLLAARGAAREVLRVRDPEICAVAGTRQ